MKELLEEHISHIYIDEDAREWHELEKELLLTSTELVQLLQSNAITEKVSNIIQKFKEKNAVFTEYKMKEFGIIRQIALLINDDDKDIREKIDSVIEFYTQFEKNLEKNFGKNLDPISLSLFYELLGCRNESKLFFSKMTKIWESLTPIKMLLKCSNKDRFVDELFDALNMEGENGID
jgi:hypothetical protein